MRPTGSLGKRFYQVEYGYAVKEAEVLSMFDGSMVGCRKLCVEGEGPLHGMGDRSDCLGGNTDCCRDKRMPSSRLPRSKESHSTACYDLPYVERLRPALE